MAQWVKVFALQACQTDFIPETHVKEEGENTHYRVVLCAPTCALTHIIHTQ